MAVKFNPFTGQLQIDEKGSGGGSSYIDGEVQNFSALPETVGSPAVDSAYLVREAEGAWLLNRKPAGIYIRTANTGTRASDWTYAGEFPDVFNDANFVLYDNGDSTKNLQFQLSGIDTATTRTLTAPNASGTIARTEDFAAPPAIGNTTPNSGAFTTLSANNGTITASAPVLDLSQTWNNAAVTFTGLRLNVTNTASAAASRAFDVQVGGASFFRVIANGTVEAGSSGLSCRNMRIGNFGDSDISIVAANAALRFGTIGETVLTYDASDTFAQRRTTNPQTFRLYNTFTDASNHERGFMRWSSNVLQIGTEKLGTGSARNLELLTDGTTQLTLDTNGHLFPQSSNSRDIGTSSLRFRWGYFWTGIALGNTSTGIGSGGDGLIQLRNNNNTSFDRLQFGGTTSSFPALKRSSTALQVRLADDSAYSVLDAQLRSQGTAPATSGATGTAGDIRYDADYIYVCTAANTWKRAAIATW